MSWNWRKAVDDARKNLNDGKYPLPRKPEASLNELTFPEDVEGISDVALANLALRLQAWFAFVTSQVANISAELGALEEVLEVQLGAEMFNRSQEIEGRQVKDVLRGLVLESNQELRALWQEKLRVDQRVRTLSGLMQSLEIQCKTLQGEQIRRASVRRVTEGA